MSGLKDLTNWLLILCADSDDDEDTSFCRPCNIHFDNMQVTKIVVHNDTALYGASVLVANTG